MNYLSRQFRILSKLMSNIGNRLKLAKTPLAALLGFSLSSVNSIILKTDY